MKGFAAMLKYGRFAVYIVILAIALNFYFRPSANRPPAPTVTVDNRAPAPIEVAWPDTQSLAVRRESIQDSFERTPFKLAFEFKPLDDGRSRMVGRSADGMTELNLVGPPEALTGVMLKASLPDDNRLAQIKNLNAMVNLAKLTAPAWTEAQAWITDNVPRALQAGEARTAVGGRSVVMRGDSSSKTLILTITGPERP
jgi:hypothetical protein